MLFYLLLMYYLMFLLNIYLLQLSQLLLSYLCYQQQNFVFSILEILHLLLDHYYDLDDLLDHLFLLLLFLPYSYFLLYQLLLLLQRSIL